MRRLDLDSEMLRKPVSDLLEENGYSDVAKFLRLLAAAQDTMKESPAGPDGFYDELVAGAFLMDKLQWHAAESALNEAAMADARWREVNRRRARRRPEGGAEYPG